MEITAKFVGVLRNASNKSELAISFRNEISIKEAVKRIIEEQPSLERILMDPELKDPRTNTLILVNGKEISVLNGLETLLKNGDEVVFLPIIHGG